MVYFSSTLWNWQIKGMMSGQNPHPRDMHHSQIPVGCPNPPPPPGGLGIDRCINWTCIQYWLTIQCWRNEQTHLRVYILHDHVRFKKILTEKLTFDQCNTSLHSSKVSNLIIRGEFFACVPHHLFPSHFPFWWAVYSTAYCRNRSCCHGRRLDIFFN